MGASCITLVLVSLLQATVAQRSAGILYEVWHTRAAQLMANVTALGGTQLTTELVLRSNGALQLNDVYVKYGLNGDIWNAQPQLGFYCLWRKRAGDASPPLPDCVNITQTATAHAALLTNAGFDYVLADITNWPVADVDGNTDISVLRPTQVLFEEWTALRAAGVATPFIATWPCSPANSTTWQWLLDNIYNNATLEPLVYKQGGKKVMFLPDNSNCYDAGTEALIQSNGGRNDVITIRMWALFGAPSYASGSWGFFSPCTSASGAYTTSMVGEGPCNQPITRDANGVPVEVSASGGYMVSQTGLPLASPGHMRGLTMQRLFQLVLETGAPNLFMSSFNEHIGGRQAPATGSNMGFNQGLPNDTQRAALWVDTYGSEFSRDIEPTMEGGDAIYNMTVSCVSLYKAGLTCATAPAGSLCCDWASTNVFANVWSLTRTDGTDALLTNNVAERNVLVASGSWAEDCHVIPGPSVFCVNTGLADGRNGPFLVYNTSAARPSPSDTQALYRCITPAGVHYFSLDSACEGNGKQEFLIGYTATSRGGEFVRQLSRCVTTGGAYIHSLDLNCDTPAPDAKTGSNIMGYVK